MLLKDKIIQRKARVAVIGLGYVGLPLAVEFAQNGFPTTGIDLNKKRVKSLNAGKSYLLDISDKELKALVGKGTLKGSSEYKTLNEIDAISICVPTPLRKFKEPDVSYIISAAREIARHVRKGQLIILESTTYPGTTREIILPMLQAKGLKAGKDFYLAFSPERVDPGNVKYTTKNIPKIVGGITPGCTKMAKLFYEQIIDKVIPLSSPEEAEMAKLLENTFRTVNIALVNEIALICNCLGIDVWKVIEGAASKPFGFMPFYPGPGLGGHCLPIDPFYLSWKAKLNDFPAQFIDLAGKINQLMPDYVVKKIAEALKKKKKSLKTAKVFVIGVAYKKNVSDVRESPAIDIIKNLLKKGIKVSYNDPYVPELKVNSRTFKSVPITGKSLRETDCAAIITDHKIYDYKKIVAGAALIMDTRNATKGISKGRNKIISL